MSIFSRKPTEFFTSEEKEAILLAIRDAEKATSGEVRVYIESRCKYVDPVNRAKEIFSWLKMEVTEQHNGVLLYVAIKDKQLAIWGDLGIHEKVGDVFWQEEVRKILLHFRKAYYVDGIASVVREIGRTLSKHFPHTDIDKNELPDDIVFGK